MDEPLARGRPRTRLRASGGTCATRSSSLGVAVETMTPQPGLPDLVFTANAGLVFHDTLPQQPLPARGAGPRVAALRRLVRRPRLHGRAPAGGDVPRGGRRRPVLRRHAVRRLPHPLATPPATSGSARRSACRVLPLELVNPRFYHLDTCFCPLAPGEAIYFPDAFDAYGQRVLDDARPEADRRSTRRRRTASAATRWWSARRWFTTAAARRWPRETGNGLGHRRQSGRSRAAPGQARLVDSANAWL